MTTDDNVAGLSAGERFDRYELLCPIASGGMGTVWIARIQGKFGFQKLFAIKTILPEYASRPQFRKMFLDEARIASKLQHPNVAHILDVGEHRGLLYLVMEYVDGDSLSTLRDAAMEKYIPMPSGVLLRVLSDVCAGLHAAHELPADDGTRGLVHRDVSPQNVLVAIDGHSKLIDFGVAKTRDRTADKTGAGTLKGKLRYMPPEQASELEVDRRADVWAVGAVLYAIVTGRAPYEADTEIATYRKLSTRATIPPLPDTVPEALQAIMVRALDADPANRYPTSLEMQNAIERAITELKLDATHATVAAFVGEHLKTSTDRRRRAVDDAIAKLDARSAIPKDPMIEQGPIWTSSLASTNTPAAKSSTSSIALDSSDLLTDAPSTPDLAIERGPVFKDAINPKEASRELAAAKIPPKKPPTPRKAPPQATPELDPGRPDAPPLMIEMPVAPTTAVKPVPRNEPTPGFFDPVAIAAARARGENLPPTPPPPETKTPEPVASSEKEPEFELAFDPREQAREAAPKKEAKPRNVLLMVLVVAAIVLVLAIGSALATVPRYARAQCIAAAAEHGVTLTIDAAHLTLDGVRLTGVHASIETIPDVRVSSDEAFLTPLVNADTVTLHHAHVDAVGDRATLSAAFAKWRATSTIEEGAIKHVVFDGARVDWPHVFGDAITLSAHEALIDIKIGKTDAVHASAAALMLKGPRGTLGPWRVDVEREPTVSRTRILFDPLVPDGPNALIVTEGGRIAATMRIARSPLNRLGLPAAFVSLGEGDATQIQADARLSQSADGHASGSLKIDVFDAHLGGAQLPIDVHGEATLAGDPNGPVEFTDAFLTLGSLRAKVVGSILLFEESFQLAFNWSAKPIPCTVLAQASKDHGFGLGNDTSPIAVAAGAARKSGDASANGMVSFDSRIPDQAQFTLTASDTCGLPIFPAP